MKQLIITLISIGFLTSFKNQALNNNIPESLEIERSICANSNYPIAGWELVSHDVDSGDHGIMGRTTCIFVDEANDPTLNTVFVGTENSGLWKTENFTDKMPVWQCLTEGSRLPGVGVVDIEVDSRNSDKIYIATALGVSFEWQYGLGILKSDDGGSTWSESSMTLKKKNLSSAFAQRVKIVKERWFLKDHLVALANKNIYKSKDEGETYEFVYSLEQEEEPGKGYFFNDLVKHASKRNILYASSVDHFLENKGSRLLISENYGDNWLDVSHLLVDNYNEETGKTDLIRIDIAVSPLRPNKLYVYCVTQGRIRKLYLIDFEDAENPKAKIFNNNQSVGSFWMSDIEVSRCNPDTVYLGRISSHVFDISKAGKNGELRVLRHANSARVHSDKRDYYIVGNSKEEKLYCANDGGVAVYEKNENGKYEWLNKTGKGLAITQFYGLGVSNFLKQYAGGAQDLGGFAYGSNAEHYYMGDGYQTEIDSIYKKTYIGFNSKVASFPGVSRSGTVSIPMGRNDCKFEIDAKGNLIGAGFATGSRGDQILKTGRRGNFVFCFNPKKGKYEEIANYPYSLEKAEIGKKDFESGLQRVSALAVSKTEPTICYVAGNRKEANKNRLWRFVINDSSKVDWLNLAATLKWSNGRLAPWQIWQSTSSICVNKRNANAIWIGYSDNFEEGRFKVAYHPNTIDVSENSKWTFIDSGLPNYPVNHLEQDAKTGYLYAATDVGVYVNKNPEQSDSVWECFNKQLPVVKVTDIEIDGKEIFISTYGRGLWKAACAQ